MVTDRGREIIPLDTVGIAAKFEDGSFSVGVRSRLATALDRMLGLILTKASLGAEAAIAVRRAELAARIGLIDRVSGLAGQRITSDMELQNELVTQLINGEARKSENKRAVAAAALDDLRSNSQDDGPDAALGEPLSEDWLNLFEAHAANASSDHLRGLWGRVLAGEVRKPGAFSLSTLRFMSELDKKIAEAFEHAVSKRISDQFIVKRKYSGRSFDDLIFLEEVGLLQNVSSGLFLRFKSIVGVHGPVLLGKRFSLRLRGKKLLNAGVEVIKITRVGQELIQILPPESDAGMRLAAAQVASQCEGIDLGEVVLDGDVAKFQVIEVLKKDGVTEQ